MQAGDVVFVTKYALTAGVISRTVKKTTDSGYVIVAEDGKFTEWFLKQDRDVFADKAKAIADAESRRTKKIKSLEKQIEKLKKLNFD